MPAVTTEPTPHITCSCGMTRTLPVATIGMPPVGTEIFCIQCSRIWRLVSVATDSWTGIQSWTWADFPAERRDVPSAQLSTLARHALGVEAALAGLGYTWHARGEA